MIEIKSVTKKYGDFTAIENVNLTVSDSSVLGLAGFNGSGKTTLLNVCAGIFSPDGGEVLLNGKPVFDNAEEKTKLFYLEDEMWFPPSATIKSGAKYYSAYYPNFDFKLLNSICDLFGLKTSSSIRSLSKGMKKQAGLAIAFAAKPEYLLIDETFDGLDPQKKEILRKLILEYINETGASVIISSHDLSEISGVCDHIAIINGKSVIFNSAIEDISKKFRRVIMTFPEPINDNSFTNIYYRKLKVSGRSVSMIICGDVEKELEKLQTIGAQSIETELLTLEEVFSEETEAENYNEAIKSIFK